MTRVEMRAKNESPHQVLQHENEQRDGILYDTLNTKPLPCYPQTYQYQHVDVCVNCMHVIEMRVRAFAFGNIYQIVCFIDMA